MDYGLTYRPEPGLPEPVPGAPAGHHAWEAPGWPEVELPLQRDDQTHSTLSGRYKTILAIEDELLRAGSAEDVCRRAIELGRDRLGFGRLGIWLVDRRDRSSVVGTWGTDERGRVCDERRRQAPIAAYEAIGSLISRSGPLTVLFDVPLFNDHLEAVGRGTQAIAALLHGDEVIGYLATDNFLDRRPITPGDCEVLTWYASVLGRVYRQKRIEDALRAVAQEAIAATGTALLRSLVRHLAAAFDARYAWIAERVGSDRARTLAVWADQSAGENVEYTLSGTPCREVLDRGTRLQPRAVRERFAALPLRIDARIESYAGAPIRDGSGRPMGLLAVMDVAPMTDLPLARIVLESFASRAATELRRVRLDSERQQRQPHRTLVLDSLPMAFYTARPATPYEITWVSEQVRPITGFEPGAFTAGGSLWATRLHPEDRDRVLDAFARLHDEGAIEVEYRWRTPNGQYTWLLDRVVLIRDEHGHPREAVGTWLAVTERRQLEIQIQQSQRMETIGRLAGGIAHDFNNLLTVIGSCCQLALDRLEPDDPLARLIGEIQNAGERSAALTQQLLAFSRRQVVRPRAVALNRMVAEMQRLLPRLIGEDVDLHLALDPALGNIKADPAQLEQVLLNLVVNARDAMPQGGRLTIETANVRLDEEYARSHATAKPGPYVMLAVSDTGVGMAPETLAHIFEPFFTTKKEGTGLGLSTVYGIVKQNNGHIWVYSEPGMGTTFKVYLPRVEEAPEPTPKSREVHRNLQGHERVLLVEDDPSLRALAAMILREYGYEVLEAENGDDALRRMPAQTDRRVDLLLTDVIMPHMGGQALAENLKSAYPNVKVLYSSGYTNDTILDRGMLEPGAAFLQKPFTPGVLLRRVREVLDA